MPRILRYAWAMPASAIGLLVGALALLLGARARWVEGTLEVGGGHLGGWADAAPERARFAAVTLGHVIVGVDDLALSGCRAHERVHVRQYERWGVFFFPAYAIAGLRELARGGDPYRDNYFEREARGELGLPGKLNSPPRSSARR